MPKKSADSALSVISENLAEANDALQGSHIMKKAHVIELANALSDQLEDPEYVKSVISKADLSPIDLAVFAIELSKYVEKDDDSLPFFTFIEVSKDPMTAYFRNPISDMAFNVFSKEIKELRAVYYDSFSACAEDVSSGISDCCMLPIYDYSDGEMWSVRRLIEKHDLSIVMTVDLPTSHEATNFVRFALLSQEQQSPRNADMLRVTAFFEEPSELSPFLEGCRFIGAKLLSAVSVPVSFYDSPAFDIDFVLPKDRFHPLGVYLSLFYPRINIGGIYKRLEVI